LRQHPPRLSVEDVTVRKEALGYYPTESRMITPGVLLKERICHMPKKVLIALPPAMLEQVDFIAKCEHRTRSDLIREALRRYLDNFRRTQGQNFSVSTVEASESLTSVVS
jgi:predicted transcriptional regulator